MKLRKPQRMIATIAREIVEGRRTKKVIVCDVVPGGGKTIMYMIFASILLRAGVIDQVILLVPRKALQKQTAKTWAERSTFNPDGFCLYESRNELPLYVRDPSPLLRASERPVVGIVATNGQLMQMRDEYVSLAKQRRTLLIVDELQFLAGDDPGEAARWTKDMLALADVCPWIVVGSGSMWRHDGDTMPLLEYGPPDEHGVKRASVDITYSLKEAIADKVVKPIYWQRIDADVRFQLYDDEIKTKLSEAEENKRSAALATFLDRPETWQPLIDRMIENWRGWKEKVYPSRFIVLARNQSHASKIDGYLRSKHHVQSVLCTTDEDDVHTKLEAFRGGQGDGLVTVAMASVGFDAPDCTHLALLTSVRSHPWLLQAVMRIGRIDYACTAEPQEQFGFAWSPKDRRLDEFMSWMRDAMDAGARERDERDMKPDGDSPGAERVFVPLGGEIGETTYESLEGQLSAAESKLYESMCRADPSLAHLPPEIVVRVAKAKDAVDSGTAPPASNDSRSGDVNVTPAERMQAMRERIHQTANRRDYLIGRDAGSTEKELAQLFGPVRTRNEAKLLESLKWVQQRLREAGQRKDAGG